MLRSIDSHAHLTDGAFDGDREDVIQRARDAGLVAVVSVGESIDAAARARVLARQHAGFVFHTAGVHPHDASGFDAERDIDALRLEVELGAVAIGECGLDYHYDHSPRDEQRAAFGQQLALARTLGRPVVVHSRVAVEDTSAMVREAGEAGVVGVMHCFGGPSALADVALVAGWYISFAGVVTFRKWKDDGLVRAVPRERLLAETDAPYLTPVPHRGTRNEPAFVLHTLRHLAAIRGEDAEALGDSCAANAVRLFGLAIPAPPA